MKSVNLLIGVLYFYLNIANGNSQGRSPGSIANEMCKRYTEDAKKNNICPASLSSSSTPPRTLAQKGEFPHMVEIGYRHNNGYKWLASGFIISKNFVLTIAYVPKPEELRGADPVIIRAGVTDHNDLTHEQLRTIESVIVHPKYNPPILRYNDIALIKVKEDFHFNKFISPVCLYTSDKLPDGNVIHSGWGPTDRSGKRQSHMLKVFNHFDRDFEKCNSTYYHLLAGVPQGLHKNEMICVGRNSIDDCQGDSGSPLQVYRKDSGNKNCMYEVVGISAFGFGCGWTQDPQVFTSVSYFIKWIEDNVWP
ncbi:CLIP domain-containing serine protease C9-like [Diabrotica virgifera virgifera]|uniref:Peptidase S1 domain-containing protein n=2 Tax=Diabrotica virgifera virgifera TaxID=50390 RepID=A0ABM5JRB0_DIAVI|nr:CLIP domain-containing serine protease C9-like [Diabrotica virgifera virgifera]